jgi:ssDNA-binding Zn-finger/Zn-ribbon topoisomerase 1
MGVPNSEVGYTSAISRREDHEVHNRTCDGIGKEQQLYQGKRETVWFIA